MRHRIFILLLAGALLLAVTTMRNTAQSSPFSDASILGSIPLWDLRAAIPFGIFCAGLFAALGGMSAQFLHSCLLLAGKTRTCTARCAGRMATAALWCGWPFVACCMGALFYIVPQYFIPAASVQPNHLTGLRPLLTYQLYGCLFLLLLCRILENLFPGRRPVGALCLLPVAACIISTDILWGHGFGLLILTALLLLPLPALFCGNWGGKVLGILLLAAAATGFICVLQPRSCAGIYPTGIADFVCYATALAVILGLEFFKIAELRRRHIAYMQQ